MNKRQRVYANPQVHQYLSTAGIFNLLAAKQQHRINDLKIVFHTMIDLSQKNVAFGEGLGALENEQLEFALGFQQVHLGFVASVDVFDGDDGEERQPVVRRQ